MHSIQHTQEAKLKMRFAKLGKKQSKETCKKKSILMMGNTRGFRKGMPSPNKGKKLLYATGINNYRWIKDRSKVAGYHHERNNPEYKQWRMAIFKKDGYRCMDCGEYGKIQGDHIYSWTKFPRLRYMIENGQTLCIPCHKAKTKGQRTMVFSY